MLIRASLKDLPITFQPSVPSTFMPGTQLNLQSFIAAITTILNEVNNSLTQSKSTGVYYSEDFMQRYYPNRKSLDTDGVTNPHYFQLYSTVFFQALPHCLPSEALAAFFQGLTFADCGSVLQACIYRAIETMVGTDEFNHAFKKQVTPFIITQFLHDSIPNKSNHHDSVHQLRLGGNPIFFLFDFRVINKDSDIDVTIGDIIYIRNVDNYGEKHREGASEGWNVICVGKNNHNENLYLGFGPTLFQRPKTYAEIKSRLIDDYNADPSVYSKNRGGSRYAHKKLGPNESIVGVRRCVSLNFTKLYEFIFQYLPNWHSMTMLQLGINNRNPEPTTLTAPTIFGSDHVDEHIRLMLRKFSYSITGRASVPRGLFLGDVFSGKTHYLLPVLSYFKQQNKKVAEINSTLMMNLKSHILKNVWLLNKNTVIPDVLLDPKADIFAFDNLDLKQKETCFVIKKVFGYVLENNAAILVYSQQPIPPLSDLIPEHMDYSDYRANNFLVLQTQNDICKYLKIDPAATNVKPVCSPP